MDSINKTKQRRRKENKFIPKSDYIIFLNLFGTVDGEDISTKADSHICRCYSTTNNQDTNWCNTDASQRDETTRGTTGVIQTSARETRGTTGVIQTLVRRDDERYNWCDTDVRETRQREVQLVRYRHQRERRDDERYNWYDTDVRERETRRREVQLV